MRLATCFTLRICVYALTKSWTHSSHMSWRAFVAGFLLRFDMKRDVVTGQ